MMSENDFAATLATGEGVALREAIERKDGIALVTFRGEVAGRPVVCMVRCDHGMADKDDEYLLAASRKACTRFFEQLEAPTDKGFWHRGAEEMWNFEEPVE